MSLLRLCFSEHLQVLNAIKNVLAGIANLVAESSSCSSPRTSPGAPPALIAVGSTGGAQDRRPLRPPPPPQELLLADR